jgi:phenylalanyl-tRNA synthetase beta chain
MRVLMGWLRELVDLPEATEEVARRLTAAGLEVEAVDRLDAGLDQVVVGEVKERTPIEGTKLSVCRVFDGEADLQIVCGAQNYAAGDHVPLAKVGAVLPGGLKIGKAKLRGHESFGMLCSSRELGFDDGVDGLHLLSRETVPGTPMAKVLGKDDVALELNVTPNRADALSHVGVARELAALLGRPLKAAAALLPASSGEAPATVEVVDGDLCPLYAARVVEGVRVGPSPAWLARRLEALGQRSVNNVVDATNLVLLECGQPLHAFDLDRLAGGRVVVRRAAEGETLKTLDGKERTLHTDDLVICDASGPVALAGVMGGEESEVKAGTTRLLLESARFSATSVRRSARRHAIHSEASHRFERGVDPEGVRHALDRLAEVILEVAGGRLAGGPVAVEKGPFARRRVTLRHARLESFLGAPVPWSEALDILRRLGLGIVSDDGVQATVEVPGARGDLSIETDLIEEVLRVRGFHTVPARIPPGSGTDARDDLRQSAESRVRAALAAAGFDEAINYAFTAPELLAKVQPDAAPIVLLNPIASDLAVMRTTLVAGLLKNVGHNLRRGLHDVRLFEIGRVYLPHETLEGKPGDAAFTAAREPRRLSFAATGLRARGWTAGKEPLDFHDVKGAVEAVVEALQLSKVRFVRVEGVSWLHPRSACVLEVAGRRVGVFGELHPSVADGADVPRATLAGEFELDALTSAAQLVARYEPLPRFPASLRDVAVVVEDRVTAAEVLAEVRKADATGLVEEAALFDVYKGAPLPDGRKNLAFSLRYRAPDRTLTDDEVNTLHAGIVERLGQTFGAELRA